MQQQVKNIIRQVAEDNKLPIQVVELIFTNQYRTLRECIKENRDATIMLPNWGKYLTSKFKVEADLKKKEELERANILSNTSDICSEEY